MSYRDLAKDLGGPGPRHPSGGGLCGAKIGNKGPGKYEQLSNDEYRSFDICSREIRKRSASLSLQELRVRGR